MTNYSSSSGLPYTTSSQFAYAIERPQLFSAHTYDRDGSGAGGVKLEPSRSTLSRVLKRSHSQNVLPASNSSASTSYSYTPPSSAKSSTQHGKNLHQRNASSPVANAIFLSSNSSTNTQDKLISTLPPPLPPKDDKAITETERLSESDQNFLWKMGQRWKQSRPKTSTGHSSSNNSEPRPAMARSMSSAPPQTVSFSSPKVSIDSVLLRAPVVPSQPVTMLAVKKRPLLPHSAFTVPLITPSSLLSYSGTGITSSPLNNPLLEGMTRSIVKPVNDDEEVVEEFEELQPHSKLDWIEKPSFSPQIYDDEEWRLHETFQRPSSANSTHRYNLCIVNSGWTQC